MGNAVGEEHQAQVQNNKSLLPTSPGLANFTKPVENEQTNSNRKTLINQTNGKIRLLLIPSGIIQL